MNRWPSSTDPPPQSSLYHNLNAHLMFFHFIFESNTIRVTRHPKRFKGYGDALSLHHQAQDRSRMWIPPTELVKSKRTKWSYATAEHPISKISFRVKGTYVSKTAQQCHHSLIRHLRAVFFHYTFHFVSSWNLFALLLFSTSLPRMGEFLAYSDILTGLSVTFNYDCFATGFYVRSRTFPYPLTSPLATTPPMKNWFRNHTLGLVKTRFL